jgi:hypothetical protein
MKIRALALILGLAISAPALAQSVDPYAPAAESAPEYAPPVYTPPVYTPPVYTPPAYTPSYGTGDHVVSGYTRRDGTYVAPYHATDPNGTKLDNYSTKGNVDPYTGKWGTKSPY